MTMISKLTTAAGTTVTKYLDKELMPKGYSRVLKEIKYAPNSKLSQLGIDRVVIRNVGKEGKSILALKGNRPLFDGVTKPTGKYEQSVTSQFKEYIAAAKTMLEKGFSLK